MFSRSISAASVLPIPTNTQLTNHTNKSDQPITNQRMTSQPPSRNPSPPIPTQTNPTTNTTSGPSSWFRSWIGGNKETRSASPTVPVLPAPANHQHHQPYELNQSIHSNPLPVMQKTGVDTLDIYAVSINSMQHELLTIKQQFRDYAEAICRMADSGSTLSEMARRTAADAPILPAAMIGFADAHETQGIDAAQLFRHEFDLEIMDPLEMWEDEAQQFLREMQRTAAAYKKQEEVRVRVDELLQAMAESDHSPSHGGDDEPDDHDDIEKELQLKLAKTDLGEACTNYSARMDGLRKHYHEISCGRAQALDVAFTRFMAQQTFLFRPALRIIDQQLQSDASLLSPSSLAAAAASPRRGRFASGAGLGSTPRRKGTLEEDIIRMSHRINRKNYQPQIHHYHSEIGGSGYHSTADDEPDAPDIHPSLRKGGKRISFSDQYGFRRRRSSSIYQPNDDAILEACRQLQTEISSRKSTEEANAELRKQLEQLKATASLSLSAETEIEELKRKLNERDAALKSPASTTKVEESKNEVVTSTDSSIPTAPALDIPNAPPLLDIPNAPPGPLMTGLFSARGPQKQLTARERELADAQKYGLPVLPQVEDLTTLTSDTTERVTLKKLHWTALTPEEIVKSPDNVWKELFLKSKKPAAPITTESNSTTSDPLAPDNLVQLCPPLVPVAPSSPHQDDSSASAPIDFEWRWKIDLPDFVSQFAQKATKAMKTKASTKRANKYAVRGARKRTLSRDLDPNHIDGEEGDHSDVDDGTSPQITPSHALVPKKLLPRIELIDAKRSYNVSISLTPFKKLESFDILRQSIMKMDLSQLSQTTKKDSNDLIEILLDILPTPEESALITTWILQGGDPTRLGEVEQFFLSLSEPGLTTRLKILATLETFSLASSSIEDMLESIHVGFRCLEASKSAISIILSIVLRLGNLMNATFQLTSNATPKNGITQTPKNTTLQTPTSPTVSSIPQRTIKQSYGFMVLPTLGKLRAVKSLDNRHNLLHFLVTYILTNVTPVGLILRQLYESLRDCARIEQAFVQAEIKYLVQSLKQTKELIDEDQRRKQVTAVETNPVTTTTTALPTPSLAPSSPHLVSLQSSTQVTISSPSNAPATATADATPYVPLPARVYEFYDYASKRVHAIECQLAVLQSIYSGLLTYYLIPDPSTTPWEQFLTAWLTFIDEYLTIEDEIQETRQQAEKRERQLQANEAIKQRKEEALRALPEAKANATNPTAQSSTSSSSSLPASVNDPTVSSELQVTVSSPF